MSEQDSQQGQKPEFIAYNVRPSQDGKGHWNRIGAAWRHKDGQGYELALDSVPVDGRVTLRELREERMQEYAEERTSREPRQRSERTRARSRERY